MQFQLSEDIGQAVVDTFVPEYGYKIPKTDHTVAITAYHQVHDPYSAFHA